MRGTRWIAPVLWAGVIEVLTSWPSLPSVPAPEGTDKVVHFTMYAILAYLVVRAARLGRPNLKAAIAVGCAVALFGAVDEWHQQFIPSRSMELGDWIADSSGAIAGLAVRMLTTRGGSGGAPT